MGYFTNASHFSISGGTFINNEGVPTGNGRSQQTTNITSTNNVFNPHNDNSTRISGELPSMFPRSAGYREEDYTRPQPEHPRYGPPQIPSTGGTATNLDSFNVGNTNVNNAFNNNSHNYFRVDRGGALPNNSRQNNEPIWMSGPHQGLPSTSGSRGSGQFQAPVQAPFQTAFPQQMGVGGPHIPLIDANIQPQGQQMGQDFGRRLNSVISQAQSTAAGISDGNHDPQASYSPLSHYREEDYTRPHPQRPSHPQIPSTGGTATNLDSFNAENTNINNAFNNNSHNYYKGGAPPNNSRQNNGSQWMSGPHQGPPSTSGSHRSGQFQAPVQAPFQAAFPQQMGVGGPHRSLNIQPLGQQMGQDFGERLNTTISQAQSMAAGTSGGNPDLQAAYSSLSRNVEGSDSMNTRMANLSLNDFQPQIPTHFSPPTSFSSDHHVGLEPTDQMGSSNLSNGHLGPYNSAVQQGSHFNSSLAHRMNEPGMVNHFPPPTETRPSYGSNPNKPPPPTSTSPSNFQPSFSVGPNSNLNKHDRSVHRTNIDSSNEHNNTLRDSFNDNSLVDSTGNHSAIDDHSNRVDEESLLEETNEQTPPVAESSVDSSGKKKKTKKKRFKFLGI